MKTTAGTIIDIICHGNGRPFSVPQSVDLIIKHRDKVVWRAWGSCGYFKASGGNDVLAGGRGGGDDADDGCKHREEETGELHGDGYTYRIIS